jgi:hypothetical protein
MPITAIALSNLWDVLLVFGAPSQHPVAGGQEHGRTIPLADLGSRDPDQSGLDETHWCSLRF